MLKNNKNAKINILKVCIQHPAKTGE